jgi:hypothetical protein
MLFGVVVSGLSGADDLFDAAPSSSSTLEPCPRLHLCRSLLSHRHADASERVAAVGRRSAGLHARGRTATAVAVVVAAALASAWLGGYALTIWPYAI